MGHELADRIAQQNAPGDGPVIEILLDGASDPMSANGVDAPWIGRSDNLVLGQKQPARPFALPQTEIAFLRRMARQMAMDCLTGATRHVKDDM